MAFMVCDEKFCHPNCFPLRCHLFFYRYFQDFFSLSLVFWSLIVMCLGTDFFGVNFFGWWAVFGP